MDLKAYYSKIRETEAQLEGENVVMHRGGETLDFVEGVPNLGGECWGWSQFRRSKHRRRPGS